MRSQHEVDALEQVLAYGKMYGYGNLISCLKRAWAKMLVMEYDISLAGAILGADTSGFSDMDAELFQDDVITLDDLKVI